MEFQMLDFHMYLMRYGEYGVQAILENIEHSEGIRYNEPVALETRWNRIMKDENFEQAALAA
jgi:hypothetical protein